MKKVMYFLLLTVVVLSTTSLLTAQDSQTIDASKSPKCGHGTPAKVAVLSKGAQANGIDAATNNNYVDVGGSTEAKGNGTVKAKGDDPKASSDAGADGKSTASMTNTPDKNSVQAATRDGSNADVNLQGNGQKNSNAHAKGSGTLDADSFLGGGPNDDFIAGSAISGAGNYNARGSKSAQGNTDISGVASTQRTATANGEKITSSGHVQSCTTAQAKGSGH